MTTCNTKPTHWVFAADGGARFAVCDAHATEEETAGGRAWRIRTDIAGGTGYMTPPATCEWCGGGAPGWTTGTGTCADGGCDHDATPGDDVCDYHATADSCGDCDRHPCRCCEGAN